jgi:hypothetical protein
MMFTDYWCFWGCKPIMVIEKSQESLPWLGDALTAIGIVVSLILAVTAFWRESSRAATNEYQHQKATIRKLNQFMVLGKSITEVLAADISKNKTVSPYKLKGTLQQVERVIGAIDKIIEGPIKEPMVVTVSFAYQLAAEQVRVSLMDLIEQVETEATSSSSLSVDYEGISKSLDYQANLLQISITPIQAYGKKLEESRKAIFPSSGELSDYWENN